MTRLVLVALAAVLLVGVGAAQPPPTPPNLGPVAGPVNEALGQVIPPALAAIYNATGQNITREDVRMSLVANMTKGDVNIGGLLIGSGRAEIQAAIHGRLEMRVISSDRIRALAQGQNGYNISADNATFLSQAYLPAETFRATLAAETIAAFQRGQEDALAQYLGRTVPEMTILALDFTWSNVSPTQSFDDTSLTEPPLVLELDLVVQYVRIESIPSLLKGYLNVAPEKQAKKDYVKGLKEDAGEPLKARDFFAAAAYTQLLNLSLQPGWSLDVDVHLPRGYSFTYFNDEVEKHGNRDATLRLDALESEDDLHKVYLASITHRKAVAFALLVALWACSLVVAFPIRFIYARRRLAKLAGERP